MVKILKHLRGRDWLLLLGCTAFILVQVWLDLAMPGYLGDITTLIQNNGEMSEILKNGGMMMLCTFGSLASAVIVGFVVAWIAAAFSKRVRSRLFDRVNDFSMGEIKSFSTASLITRSTNDITQVQMVIAMGVQGMIKAPITAIWAVVEIAGKGTFEWSMVTAVAVGVQVIMFGFIVLAVMPKFKRMQRLTDNLNRIARENLMGVRVVRAYNAEDFQDQKFQAANEDLTSTTMFTNRSMAAMMPMMNTILSGLSLSIFWIGAYLIDAASMSQRAILYPNMVVFSNYVAQVVFAFLMLVMVIMILPRASVSARRINEVLDTQSTIVDGDRKEGEAGLSGEVEFRNVCFKYPDAAEYVLKDISFTASQGQTVAFIGSTGSGKSTLINLVPRFFDASEGQVLIDGVDVRDYKLDALYNKIGYVPQQAVLFRGTVESNVAFGDNGKEQFCREDIASAIRIAQGEEFVLGMEGGYEADISQGGANISGGQKQRLAIARAICRKPEIYIFDDSFSALDYKTDRVLRRELKKQTSGVTSLIVAQRVGTIMDADLIIVLNEGRVVGRGKHKDLIKSCEVYRQIATSQLSEEELAHE